MAPDATAADTGFLTIDQAVANLDAADAKDAAAPEQDAAAAEQPNTEAEPAAEVASEPETATDGETAETDDGTAEGEQPELQPIEPPRFWDAKAKDRFRELPRDLQELVLSKEVEHDKATASKFEEAAKVKKSAETEASKLAGYTAKLDKLIPQAETTFASRWGEGDIDWSRVAREQGVEVAFQLKTQHDQEKSALETLKTTQKEVQTENTRKFIAERLVKLQTTCPDLVDPKSGADRQLELVRFWTSLGKDANRIISQADDVELSILYDAMQHRKAKASAAALASAPRTSTTKPAATPPRPTVKSTAAPSRAGSPKHAEYAALAKMKTHTLDQATRFLTLQEELNP